MSSDGATGHPCRYEEINDADVNRCSVNTDFGFWKQALALCKYLQHIPSEYILHAVKHESCYLVQDNILEHEGSG